MTKNDYLWDRTGPPDPQIEQLERILGELREDVSAPKFSMPVVPIRRPWHRSPVFRLAAAAMVLGVIGGWFYFQFRSRAWQVATLEGAPRIGSKQIGESGRLAVGEWLETDSASRARIAVGLIGEVHIEPNTRLRLVAADPANNRLDMVRGKLRARIWAPPKLFFVQTPYALATDLGCAYTLAVEDSGSSTLRVESGWVAFDLNGRESFVPAGALSVTRPGLGPGTPVFDDASPALRAALDRFDTGGVAGGVAGGVKGGVESGIPGGPAGGVPGGVAGGVEGGVPGGIEGAKQVRAEVLGVVLAESRPRDALTLWHLLARTEAAERARVYDRLAALAPPPVGVTREGIVEGDRHMRELWWNALGLGSTTWWRFWLGPPPAPR